MTEGLFINSRATANRFFSPPDNLLHSVFLAFFNLIMSNISSIYSSTNFSYFTSYTWYRIVNSAHTISIFFLSDMFPPSFKLEAIVIISCTVKEGDNSSCCKMKHLSSRLRVTYWDFFDLSIALMKPPMLVSLLKKITTSK